MNRRDALVAFAGVIAGFLYWGWLSQRVGPLLLPSPFAVGESLISERSRLASATVQTAGAAFGGLALACLLGVGSSVAGWWSKGLRAALVPYTVFVQIVPIVAIAPLLVVWLGYGRGVAMITASIAAFYPVFSSMNTGLRAPAAEWVDLFRLYRASRARELLELRIPAALPSLFAGLRTAGGLAVIGAIVGEFVGSNGSPPSLGYLVVFSARSANLGLCFAAVAMSGAVVLAFLALLGLAERRLVGRWFGA